MKAHEHRAIGDEATAAALVDIAVGRTRRAVFLRYGDVIALSGDFFVADPSLVTAPASSRLFDLAAVPGERGRMPGTRDEIVCALKVMAVDEQVRDPRFEDGGEFAHYELSPMAARSEVERRVRDRFLALAAANADHFVAPWGDEPGAPRPEVSRFGSARGAFRVLHAAALDEAWRLGRFWHDRYPEFWESHQHKIAADTAAALREVAKPLRLVSRRVLYDRTLAAVHARTRTYPPVSLGDLLGRVLHDWDNDHGLLLDNGEMLFGDGHIDEGAGRRMAMTAVWAGNDDVEVAYALGASASRSSGEALYAAVREATGAPANAFAAETLLPRPSPDNPPLNWRARDIDELWQSPIVGSTGTTVGAAVCQVLEVGGEVSRRLDCLGQGVVEAFGVLDVPVLGGWLGRKACQAYHQGFIEGLARDPRAAVAVVARAGSGTVPDRAPASV